MELRELIHRCPDIMVVDDNPSSIDFLSEALKAHNYRVRPASNGRLAIQAALSEPPDIILLDITMPELDGYEVCWQLKENPLTRDIPVIFVTMLDQDFDEEKGLLLGAVDYVTKPVRLPILLARIKAHLQLKFQFDMLEEMVKVRTAELEASNQALCDEIRIREEAEAEVRRINENLEELVHSRTNELKHANKELEAFNSMVSHDLRSPVRHIRLFCELFKENCSDQLTEDALSYINDIESCVARMDALIDGLLRLSQVNNQTLHYLETDPKGLVGEILHELQGRYPEHSVEIDLANLPAIVCDPVLIRQVFANLLGNAWKYSFPVSGARISVRGYASDDEWIFEIEDNGVGFDMKYYDRLFTAFHRLTSDPQFEGTGLGLALVYRIIERHGGRIWAESSPAQRTVFSFALPRMVEPQ